MDRDYEQDVPGEQPELHEVPLEREREKRYSPVLSIIDTDLDEDHLPGSTPDHSDDRPYIH